MANDFPLSDASLLAPKLKSLNGIQLAETLDKDKWNIITETINEMYNMLYVPLNKLTTPVFEMLEIDLITITATIVDAPHKEKDHDNIIEHLGMCRRKASQAAECYSSKDPGKRDIGRDAILILQSNLKSALDYIKPINKKFNPSLYKTGTTPSSSTDNLSKKT